MKASIIYESCFLRKGTSGKSSVTMKGRENVEIATWRYQDGVIYVWALDRSVLPITKENPNSSRNASAVALKSFPVCVVDTLSWSRAMICEMA